MPAVKTAVFVLASVFTITFVGASSAHAVRHDHGHAARSALPGKWYHEDAHPVHNLLRRGPDATPSFAAIGSPSWSAGFPKGTPDPNQLPKPWVDALQAAVSAGKIPNVPQTTSIDNGPPTYPSGYDPNSPQVCSAYFRGCRNKDDIWDAPNGYVGTSFDDGPLPDQVTLNDFLAKNNEKTTHFMIGVNMLANPQILQDTINQGHDIAVHTWTHRQLTTLSNLDILGELGWSVELIRNSTGGKIPRYWRPPTGDSDERVRAIAKEVFGLTAVIWNHSTEDWSLTTVNGTTPQAIHDTYTQWLAGPKSPGMIVLEHVLSSASVAAFIDAYPLIKSNGWKTGSVIKLIGDGSAFQAGASSVIANPATVIPSPPSPSFSSIVQYQSKGTGSAQNIASSTSTSSSAASPTESKNAGVSVVPSSLFGSAGVVAFSYFAYLLL